VIETPLANKIVVFKSGIWYGLKGKIPLGGQIMPVSRSGESLMWKNAQKNLKKK